MKELAEFTHRTDYDDLPAGRDRYVVEAVGRWVTARLPEHCRGAQVLDVGCGAQPFRGLIESSGGRYAGMDVVQNARETVTVVAALDRDLPAPWPDSVAAYDVVLCTEVLEHVFDWRCAFGNLRRLTRTGGVAILTVPFVFPLHMEPFDFFRATPHGLRRLAAESGFETSALDLLGGGVEVLSTVAADLSILPGTPGAWPRLKARVLRAVRSLLLAGLSSRWIRSGLHINANSYLSAGLVLRAMPPAAAAR